jgi:hypothetical protein
MAASLAQTDNPILWQETTHQQRGAPRWMRWGALIGLTTAALCVAFTWWLYDTSNGYPAMQMALYLVWIIQAMTAVRAVAAGANAISREHVGLTWDALVLTGVSVRLILFGKWRAALRSMRVWLLMAGVVRIAMLPIFSLGILKTYASFYGQNSYSSYYRETTFEWVPWAWILAVVASVALTTVDLLCCTAIGLAASAVIRRGILASIIAVAIRFLPVIFFSAFMRYQLGPTFFWRWWGRTEFSLSDGGTSALMVLALPSMPWTYGDHEQALPGLILAGVMFVTLLLVSLCVTWIAIRRTGALPHLKRTR